MSAATMALLRCAKLAVLYAVDVALNCMVFRLARHTCSLTNSVYHVAFSNYSVRCVSELHIWLSYVIEEPHSALRLVVAPEE